MYHYRKKKLQITCAVIRTMKTIPHPLLSPNLTSSQKLNSLSNSAADSQSHAFRVDVVQLLGVEGSGDDEPENVHRVGKEQTEEVRRCESTNPSVAREIHEL